MDIFVCVYKISDLVFIGRFESKMSATSTTEKFHDPMFIVPITFPEGLTK